MTGNHGNTVYTQGQEFLTFRGFSVGNKLGVEMCIKKCLHFVMHEMGVLLMVM